MVERKGRRDRILGCLLGGALGDAYGGIAERGRQCLSDDTQLTLATCESIADLGRIDPAHVASTFRQWFDDGRLTGLGSSTLKALRDLQAGAHWALSGARGEMAAGNGGAMRIAPLAFVPDADRVVIRDVVRITHHSDEAYVGALAVVEAIRGAWSETLPDLLHAVAEQLPDSRVRDRMVSVAEVSRCAGLPAIAALGTSGYVVDTIASIAGQVAGARLGAAALPAALLDGLSERDLVERIGGRFAGSGGVA